MISWCKCTHVDVSKAYVSLDTCVFVCICGELLGGNSRALYFLFPDGVALVIKRANHQSFPLVFFLFPFIKPPVSACVLSNKRSQGLLWVLENALSNLKIDKSLLSHAQVNPIY